ncbi:uncharacterized protein K444DRAFT_38650 [Hyaloscypha bicolor E]|jgi:hypothetical protein|uniref:Uncharacterized protein n=1 Tax=Hyaloscypha bicolor E TaxID=1095630 RepID=A0A2J6T1I6_9HELO|nr:uncharacterized protein K444DRAFT_38650 [Hyaloscypha bicolor E]PMD56888.1 hypothetical protein K444DRAFT_38650 [Hyaloscypha bicolor E]
MLSEPSPGHPHIVTTAEGQMVPTKALLYMGRLDVQWATRLLPFSPVVVLVIITWVIRVGPRAH